MKDFLFLAAILVFLFITISLDNLFFPPSLARTPQEWTKQIQNK